MINVFISFAVALALTIAVEGAAMYIWSKNKDWVYYSFLCNCATNPAVNLLVLLAYNFTELGYYGPLAVLEILAWAAEALIYMRLCGFGLYKAIAVSAVLNGLSFAAGLLIF